MIVKQLKDSIKFFNHGVEVKVYLRLSTGKLVIGEFLLDGQGQKVSHHFEDEGGTLCLHVVEEE